jgi:hypothetical protein
MAAKTDELMSINSFKISTEGVVVHTYNPSTQEAEAGGLKV